MAKINHSIEEKYLIPSKGLLYSPEDHIPSEFILRSMTTKEEKLRLSSNDNNIMARLVKACTVNADDEFDPLALKLADLTYLIYMLRVVTYGSVYPVTLICPRCRKEFKVDIDIDEVPVSYLEEGTISEPFDIGPLPVSGDTLQCRILDSKDVDKINLESKRILKKFPDYVGDPSYILLYQYRITGINGEHKPSSFVRDYIENLDMKDMRVFDAMYDDIQLSFGLDMDRLEVCPSCSSDVEFRLPINAEFFRPKTDVGDWRNTSKKKVRGDSN